MTSPIRELEPAARGRRAPRRRFLPAGWRGLVGVEAAAPPVVGPPVSPPLLPSEEWFCGRVRHLAHVYGVAGLTDPVLAAVLDAVREGWAPAEPLLRTIWSQAGQRSAGRVW